MSQPPNKAFPDKSYSIPNQRCSQQKQNVFPVKTTNIASVREKFDERRSRSYPSKTIYIENPADSHVKPQDFCPRTVNISSKHSTYYKCKENNLGSCWFACFGWRTWKNSILRWCLEYSSSWFFEPASYTSEKKTVVYISPWSLPKLRFLRIYEEEKKTGNAHSSIIHQTPRAVFLITSTLVFFLLRTRYLQGLWWKLATNLLQAVLPAAEHL